MKPILVLACATAAFCATTTDWPTGNRTTPPTINSVSPLGVERGATVELTLDGFNLAKASAIYFSQPGIRARIVSIKELPDRPDVRLGSNGTVSTVDLGPLPPRNQVTVELDVSPNSQVGPVGFRLLTPLGTTPERRVFVEPYYGESPDKEPNETPEQAFDAYTPTILVGAISKPGDQDYYKIHVKAGEDLVFNNVASILGSSLQPLIGIYDENQTLLKQFSNQGGLEADRFSYHFDKAGTYYIRIADADDGGDTGHFYRVMVGKLPLVNSVFPLGVPKDKTAEITLSGYNLGSEKVPVAGQSSQGYEREIEFRPTTPTGKAFNWVRLAVGNEPEVRSSGANTSVATAQPVSVPVTINGKMLAAENDFRFHARKGEKLIFDVNAARLGSKLDSLLEIYDLKGEPVQRATIRCVLESSTTLSDRDSRSPGIRITSPDGFHVGDSIMIGSEIMEVESLPRTPDDDFRFTSFGGQRLALLDTTPEFHAVDSPVYKVKIYPPGKQFAPNGLPVVRLPFRNDDGGPGWGKDSLLHFTAPADGDYVVKIRDVRRLKGEDCGYRLTVRHSEPDFMLSVNPKNPNVPVGGRIPVTVTALRIDHFNGPINVEMERLPAGLHATKGVIPPWQVSTTLLLSADNNASLDRAVPLKVTGRAEIGGQWVAHPADPEEHLKLISLMPKPDIDMVAQTKEVEITPGGTATVEVAIQRNNDFGGRVPVEVRNLPPDVRILNVGLNGVLINENDQQRTFTLRALPNAKPIEQPIIVSGKIETRADAQQNSYAAQPILLKVKPKTEISGTMVPSAAYESSAKK